MQVRMIFEIQVWDKDNIYTSRDSVMEIGGFVSFVSGKPPQAEPYLRGKHGFILSLKSHHQGFTNRLLGLGLVRCRLGIIVSDRQREVNGRHETSSRAASDRV